MTKKLLTILLTSATATLFGLEFFVANAFWAKDAPEGGYKYSTCPWGQSFHYDADLYKTKPGWGDTLTVRSNQIIEFDKNFKIGSLNLHLPKLAYAKGKTIDIRENFITQLGGTSKMSFEDCKINCGKNMHLNYWHKARSSGRTVLSFTDTIFNLKGSLFCIIPVHPDAKLRGDCGPIFNLKGSTKLQFATSAVIDEIFFEQPKTWKFRLNFIPTDKVPSIAFGTEIKVRGLEINLETKDAKLKPGTYALVTIVDRGSKLKDFKFFLNGQSYGIGNTFQINGNTAEINYGVSPDGKDSSNQNDIVLIIKK